MFEGLYDEKCDEKIITCTVKPRLSGLTGNGLNSLDNPKIRNMNINESDDLMPGY